MSEDDDVCYVPFAFGYSNYSRPSAAKVIQFCNIPGVKAGNCSGAVLGGAGIGISSKSTHPDISIEYAKFLCAPGYQSSKYFNNGGQPASLSAWKNKPNDSNAHGFFSGTLATLENSYLRPTFPGFVHYFRDAGEQISSCLNGDKSISKTVDWLITNYAKLT